MDQEKMLELQLQMRQNNAELQSFIQGLDQWEGEIKKKDEDLKKGPKEDEVDRVDSTKPKSLPPVRNSLQKKKKKKKQKPQDPTNTKAQTKRISGYDFKAWDKFDVDKALGEIGGDEKSGSSSEYETDEEWEIERRIKQANVLKDEGNLYFKQMKYDEAIECYTRAIECDPTNAILPANRAMALLKQNKFGAADKDCTTSISLDPTYVKAYSRRASARLGLSKLEEAARDFDKILVLEPGNKFAKQEKEKLLKKLNLQEEEKKEKPVIDSDTGVLKAIYKPPSERSKKPLRRIKIEEVGLDAGKTIRQAIAKTEASQSEAKKRVTEKDSQMFEHFVSSPAQQTKDSMGSSDQADNKTIVDKKTDQPENDNSILDIDMPSKGEKEQKVMESTNISQNSSMLPEIPRTSYQFQADWKTINNHPEKVFHYLKAIDPTHYVLLFGQALDAEILNLILSTLVNYYLPANIDVFPVLDNLTKVKRFSMTAMFMSSKEKQGVRVLIDSLKEHKLQTDDEIGQLAKAYEL